MGETALALALRALAAGLPGAVAALVEDAIAEYQQVHKVAATLAETAKPAPAPAVAPAAPAPKAAPAVAAGAAPDPVAAAEKALADAKAAAAKAK